MMIFLAVLVGLMGASWIQEQEKKGVKFEDAYMKYLGFIWVAFLIGIIIYAKTLVN